MRTVAVTQTKKPEDYLREPYSRILVPEEDGAYSAEVLEFPGCYSFGDTAQEAISNLEEAARNWIGACIQNGQDIPAPTGHNEYSGKIALRLPASLHKEAARMALREKVSLNQFLLNAIAAKVGAASYHNQLLRKLDGYFLSQSATENTSADRRLTLTVTLRDERPGGIQWQDKSEPTAPRLSMTM